MARRFAETASFHPLGGWARGEGGASLIWRRFRPAGDRLEPMPRKKDAEEMVLVAFRTGANNACGGRRFGASEIRRSMVVVVVGTPRSPGAVQKFVIGAMSQPWMTDNIKLMMRLINRKHLTGIITKSYAIILLRQLKMEEGII